eukprot:TRINITY_DN18301_c0_g3_i1.p1 TRINITY_DN18301_c0_g3~~TRINITY_DN18301_c0_g3_i1.p1  ORF type:complete len:726 (+),score=124.85 TRINITY_DN18301_c0_g3_i1:140-2317(+)
MGSQLSLLSQMLIRPPRAQYTTDMLGPPHFSFAIRRRVRDGEYVRGPPIGGLYQRRDIELEGNRGKLQCSMFSPAVDPEARRPCVVFLHGNCSSRLEVIELLPTLLPRDITVFCLDFSGSGKSDGEYISLGYYEEDDLRVVIDYLKSLETISTIGLWGRSMGATTLVLRAAEDSSIGACVIDSAFGDLQTVAEELINRVERRVPEFFVASAIEVVRLEVMTKAGFDPFQTAPILKAQKATAPAMFAVAIDDQLVFPHHTFYLHNAWAGERTLRVFQGGHNGMRPRWFLSEAADFLERTLRPERRASGDGGDAAATAPEVAAQPEQTAADADANAGAQQPATPGSELQVSTPQMPRPGLRGSGPFNKFGSAPSRPQVGQPTDSAIPDLADTNIEGSRATDQEQSGQNSTTTSAADHQPSIWQDDEGGAISKKDVPPLSSPYSPQLDRAGAGVTASPPVAQIPKADVPGRRSDFAVRQKTSEMEPVQDSESPSSAGVLEAEISFQLTRIGFPAEDAAEAAGRCSSLEEAVERLMTKSDVLGKLGRLETCLPQWTMPSPARGVTMGGLTAGLSAGKALPCYCGDSVNVTCSVSDFKIPAPWWCSGPGYKKQVEAGPGELLTNPQCDLQLHLQHMQVPADSPCSVDRLPDVDDMNTWGRLADLGAPEPCPEPHVESEIVETEELEAMRTKVAALERDWAGTSVGDCVNDRVKAAAKQLLVEQGECRTSL